MTASSPDFQALLAAKAFFGREHPLFSAFGIEVGEMSQEGAAMSMACVNDVQDSNGAVHRGALSTLVDTTCGLAIFARLGDMRPIATIDLRVDFIAAPQAGEGIYSKVTCFAVEGEVAYVRGEARGCDSDSLLASTSGSFAIGTLGPSFDPGSRRNDE
ncbi:MAG: PaaI family thioesterase [Alcanivoracaceae bacterium]|nr:PaaI family thioesterase [Alcanivoracaceae bacterium]